MKLGLRAIAVTAGWALSLRGGQVQTCLTLRSGTRETAAASSTRCLTYGSGTFGTLASLFALLLLSTSAPQTLADEPVEYSAYYEARTNGARGNAERHLIRQADGSYRLNVSLEARVAGIQIGTVQQASEFDVLSEAIRPRQYSYQVTGVTRDSEAVSFNWEAGVAVSQEDEQVWRVELGESTLDELSYQQNLARTLQDWAGPWDSSEILEFEVVNGGELEVLQFRLLGEEVLETPMGRFNTVKLERVRADDSGRLTNFWLAKDWHFLLVRIEQVSSSGLRVELALENALVGGEQVTALP